jgi:hypothetical protein
MKWNDDQMTHNSDDPACERWTGDRSGADLWARCAACSPRQIDRRHPTAQDRHEVPLSSTERAVREEAERLVVPAPSRLEEMLIPVFAYAALGLALLVLGIAAWRLL